jgi:hypothetical protein
MAVGWAGCILSGGSVVMSLSTCATMQNLNSQNIISPRASITRRTYIPKTWQSMALKAFEEL